MKIFLPLFFLFFSETSFAQFNTIKQGTNNYKVKVLEIEKDGKTIDARAIDFLKNEPEKSDSLKVDRKSTRLNSSHTLASRMPSSA